MRDGEGIARSRGDYSRSSSFSSAIDSLERAIGRFLERGPELQRAIAARASHVRSMDEHFDELFACYAELTPGRAAEAARVAAATQIVPAALEGALALGRR